MYKIENIKEILKKKDSRETKDKIEIIDNKNLSLFFLFNGHDKSVNSNRAISAAIKYVRNNYQNYQNKKGLDLKELVLAANKKILELNLPGSKSGLMVLFVPKSPEAKPNLFVLGKIAIYTVSYNQLTRINFKQSEKTLGDKSIENDIVSIEIKNDKTPLFICNDGFMDLLAKKRKDIIRILNYKDLSSARASMNRLMKTRNDKNLAYLFVKKSLKNK